MKSIIKYNTFGLILLLMFSTSYAVVCINNQTKDLNLGFDFAAGFCLNWDTKSDGPKSIRPGSEWCYYPNLLCKTKNNLNIFSTDTTHTICYYRFASSGITVTVTGENGHYICSPPPSGY